MNSASLYPSLNRDRGQQNPGSIRLTPEELKQLDTPKEIFMIIRVLDVIEKCYSLDKISEDEYKRIVERQLNNFNRLTKHIANFNLDKFLREYDLTECTWAAERIKSGLQDQRVNEKALFVNITSKFHHMNDCLFLNQNKPVVSGLKPILEELLFLIGKASPYLGSAFRGQITLEQQLEKLNQKNISEILFPNEFTELQAAVESSQKEFLRSLER